MARPARSFHLTVLLAAPLEAEGQRAVLLSERYAAVTEASCQFVVRAAPDRVQAWTMMLDEALGDYVHFGSVELEPHPGWWQAAEAAVRAGYVPAPVLWSAAGELLYPEEPSHDWAPVELSRFPTLGRVQARELWPPRSESWLQACVRSEYAFTFLGDR